MARKDTLLCSSNCEADHWPFIDSGQGADEFRIDGPFRAFNMDKMVGKGFETGLANLKTIAKIIKNFFPDMSIPVLSVRRTVRIPENGPSNPTNRS